MNLSKIPGSQNNNCIFYCVFWFFYGSSLYVLWIGAVDFDDLTVFLPSYCQVTKLPFSRLYTFFGFNC